MPVLEKRKVGREGGEHGSNFIAEKTERKVRLQLASLPCQTTRLTVCRQPHALEVIMPCPSLTNIPIDEAAELAGAEAEAEAEAEEG